MASSRKKKAGKKDEEKAFDVFYGTDHGGVASSNNSIGK